MVWPQLNYDELAGHTILKVHNMKEKIRQAIRNKLEEMREYEYSDGCVLFWETLCTEEEKALIRSGHGGMLDTLARVLAEEIAPLLDQTR